MKKEKLAAFPGLLFAFLGGVVLTAALIAGSVPAKAEEQDGMYTVCFHEDFDAENDHTFVQEIWFGEETALLPNPWSHDGYRFAGWFASGCGVNHALANAYRDGDTVLDLGRGPADVIDLYAGWSTEETISGGQEGTEAEVTETTP